MCYASSAPGGVHLSYDDCCRAIDHLVEAEGRPEVLQLSGGEPTIHPEFFTILDAVKRGLPESSAAPTPAPETDRLAPAPADGRAGG